MARAVTQRNLKEQLQRKELLVRTERSTEVFELDLTSLCLDICEKQHISAGDYGMASAMKVFSCLKKTCIEIC